MIGERKGSKILSCTHAGRIITLVPVAEVLQWHFDPLFIMQQITHGVVSAAWQNRHPAPMLPRLAAPQEDKYDVSGPWTFNEQTYLRIQKTCAVMFGENLKDAVVHILKDGICAPSSKTEPLIFVVISRRHINCCAVGILFTVCFMIICTEMGLFLKGAVCSTSNINISLSN